MSITNSTFILGKSRPIVYGLSGTKRKVTKESSLDIRYGEIHIRQYHTVTYIGYALDEDLLGESIALNVIKKINITPKLSSRENTIPTQPLHRLLFIAIIQPYLHHTCSAIPGILALKKPKDNGTNTLEQMHSFLPD